MHSRPVRGVVLVVEDDTVSRLVLSRMAKKLGHAVITAADLASARTLLASALPDVVLCDYFLPDGTVIDLMTSARRRGLSSPFVIVTGVAENADLDRMPPDVRPFVFAALTKPVTSRALTGCLTSVFDVTHAAPR